MKMVILKMPFLFKKKYKEDIKYLEKIVKTIIKKDENFCPYYFLSFFLTQNCRVLKSLKNIWSISDEIENNDKFKKYRGKFNFRSIAVIFTHAHIYRLGQNLIFKNYKIVIIENNSSIPFITSDNPIINVYSYFMDYHELHEDNTELYYPLSPNIAMLFTNRPCYNDTDIIQAIETDVKIYNEMILKMSEKFVYSNNKTVLEQLP